jgi:drug/metabolite transporter (DMT)-like permease
MVTVFALAAALMYGSADFLGGAAARGAHVLSVVMMSAAAGVIVVAIAAVVSGGPATTAGIGWGIAGGSAGAVGLMIFYAGLAAGPMSVVSPLSAVVATVLPVGVALAQGERPGVPVYAGALGCLVAIGLVSSGGRGPAPHPAAGAGPEPAAGLPDSRRPSRFAARRAIAFGIASGASFGLFFLFLRNAGESGGFWPVLAARISGMTVIGIAALAMRRGPVPRSAGSRVYLAALGAGAVDAGANICYVIATRAGLFGLAIVLTALYPGVTVLLARIVLGERLRWVQRIGLVIAAAGIALVTA